MSLNNLGQLLYEKGEFAESRVKYERALAIREKVLDPNHPDTATSLNNLAGLLEAQGDRVGARPYYERALAILERIFGANHPKTKLVAQNTAMLLDDLKCRQEAITLRGKFGLE